MRYEGFGLLDLAGETFHANRCYGVPAAPAILEVDRGGPI
jgi:hypothetical protein